MSNGKKPATVVHRTNPNWDDVKIPWDDDKLVNRAWDDAIGADGLEAHLWESDTQKSFRRKLIQLLRAANELLIQGHKVKEHIRRGLWNIIEPNKKLRENWEAAKAKAAAAAAAAAPPPPPPAPPVTPAPALTIVDADPGELLPALAVAHRWGFTGTGILDKVALAFPTFPPPYDKKETGSRIMRRWSSRKLEAFEAAEGEKLQTFLDRLDRSGRREKERLRAENERLKAAQAAKTLTPGA